VHACHTPRVRGILELELKGAGGEPVDLWRTCVSHGFAGLPPIRLDEDARVLEITVPVPGYAPRIVTIEQGRPGYASLRLVGRAPGARERGLVLDSVGHVLRLDEDLSGFYAAAASDPELSWAARGAGRMLRSPTVLEDVVKTICTTNCAWSATERMVGALVEHLGEPAPGAPATGPFGRLFPTAEAMAEAGDDFYREAARAGYRGPYLRSLARSVAEGRLDLEAFAEAGPDELPDEELERRLRALPGVGPYAAAHVMMLLGRYSRLILDSWTRPKYARLNGRRSVSDKTIERRFRRYRSYAGLAFWLYLTRDWVPEPVEEAPAAAGGLPIRARP
jgi:3-methyladenine DNA glycosylase/8-oxoguanine DNA glycosylase